MQRPATKQSTRAANAEEKRFIAWVKAQPCIQCMHPAPSIVDHCKGSAFIHNKVLVGHWFILPLCVECDAVKTHGSHREYERVFDESQAQSWERLIRQSPVQPPQEVTESILDWGGIT